MGKRISEKDLFLFDNENVLYMPAKIINLLIVSTCLLIGEDFLNYPKGWEELQNDSGWQLVSESDKVQVYTKSLSVSPLNALKAELKTKVDWEKLVETAWLVQESANIFPNAFIIEAGIYKQFAPNRYHAYQVIDIPILDPRLYCFNSHLMEKTIHWVAADIEFEDEKKKDMVIPKVNFGSWQIISGDKENKVIYRLCTDPSGSVPTWIVEKANQRYVPQMMLDLESFARKDNN